MILKYKGTATYERVYNQLEKVEGMYEDSYKEELQELLKLQMNRERDK